MELAFRLPVGIVKGKCADQVGDRQLLAPREVIELRPRRAGSLVCICGEVWVTAERHPGDHLLHTGERLHFAAGEGVFVQALNGAALTRIALARE
jgi:hypothetical protein